MPTFGEASFGSRLARLVLDNVHEHYCPEDVFTEEELTAWARAHGTKSSNPALVRLGEIRRYHVVVTCVRDIRQGIPDVLFWQAELVDDIGAIIGSVAGWDVNPTEAVIHLFSKIAAAERKKEARGE